MDEEYDVVICGTGLTECILSGLLSVHGKKVLHVDRNRYYGGESASLNLTNLYQKFKPGQTPPKIYGENRDWNVDLIPKFVMACGKLVKILLLTKVTRYLEWQVVDGTYVFQHQKGGLFSSERYIHKVPSNDMEALKSPMLSLLEKNRVRSFFSFCSKWKQDNRNTHDGLDPQQTSSLNLYKHFGLQPNTIDFMGHAVALYTNDEYLKRPYFETMEKIQLYMYSISQYGQSPFLYPIYGLGGLPEGFSRLSAIHGGTYMLSKPIEFFLFNDDGRVCGVQSVDGEIAKCKFVVCDPSYAMNYPRGNKVRSTGQVIRCICILDHPIPNASNKNSLQIIIPQKQVNRKDDIYIAVVSHTHGVAKKGFWIALVSTTVETQNPLEEIQPALDLLGPCCEKFVYYSDLYEPVDDGTTDQVFVSKSYDATSHFESATDDVLKIWRNIMGSELDLAVAGDDLQP